MILLGGSLSADFCMQTLHAFLRVPTRGSAWERFYDLLILFECLWRMAAQLQSGGLTKKSKSFLFGPNLRTPGGKSINSPIHFDRGCMAVGLCTDCGVAAYRGSGRIRFPRFAKRLRDGRVGRVRSEAVHFARLGDLT